MTQRSNKRQREKPAVRGTGEGPARPATAPRQAIKQSAQRLWPARDWLLAVLLLAAVLLAYLPALQGTPVWDDAGHLTKPGLRSLAGLARIWCELGATQQYYPVSHSVFWIEHWLWGDWYAGYHLVNICLHAISALLLVRILRRLEIPGAWLAAFLWALHPVQVESVAWMSELKNTLSGVCYFGAALLYLRFDRERSRTAWIAAFAVFTVGLFAKSVIDTLPAALLLVFYWKRGALHWRKDALPLIPFFVTGIGAGLLTAWVEHAYIGAQGGDFHLSPIERGLIAGRAFWFYLGKLLWPADLIFSYPRWHVSALEWWQFLFPALALMLVAGLACMARRWGRAPIVALLYFGGTLFPALGFVNIYPFRYSFVADHFQYLACAGPLVLAAAGFERLRGMAGKRFTLAAPCVYAVLAGLLGVLTWRHAGDFRDAKTLWLATLARNPGSWLAHNNLGDALLLESRAAEATAQYREALRINPADVEAVTDLGVILYEQGRPEEAVAQYRAALRLNPDYGAAHEDLGLVLQQLGQAPQAAAEYHAALKANRSNEADHFNLGNLLLQQRLIGDAIAEYREALRIDPAYPDAHNNLGVALLREGRVAEAIPEFREALRINPAYSDARTNLDAALGAVRR